MAIIHSSLRGREAVTAHSFRGSLICGNLVPGLLDFCSFWFLSPFSFLRQAFVLPAAVTHHIIMSLMALQLGMVSDVSGYRKHGAHQHQS